MLTGIEAALFISRHNFRYEFILDRETTLTIRLLFLIVFTKIESQIFEWLKMMWICWAIYLNMI